jgi:hypothetical protein
MRNTFQIILLIGILTFTYSCGVQKYSESDSNKELPKELFQRWKLDYGIANGEKINGLPQSSNNDYEFKQNGEYILYNVDGNMTGTWKYNSIEKIIYLKREDGEINGKIVDFKAKNITLIPAGKGFEGTAIENFLFYYIPKTE